MKDLDHARMMLAMAGKDLKAIKAMGDPEDFSDEVFGFHAQQAVEKSLKAWLSAAGIKYSKVHDLQEIMRQFDRHGIAIPPEFIELQELTDFAVVFRYEAAETLSAPLDRSGIIAKVESLHRHVGNLIST